jgi:hypothetical protein
VEDPEVGDRAQRTPESGGGHGWHRFVGLAGSPVEDIEGTGGGCWRSPVEDELRHYGWRELRSERWCGPRGTEVTGSERDGMVEGGTGAGSATYGSRQHGRAQ